MRGRLLALPTLLLALAGVGQATRTLFEGLARESAREGELAEADRVVVYQVTRASGPRFRLPGGPEDVHLFVHLELPRALTGVPGGVYRFAVVATLRDPGGALLWERALTQRTRQTRDAGSGEGWNYEAAVAPGGRLELSDSVSMELQVPAVPVGGVLELRLGASAGLLAADGVTLAREITGATALVRAYRRIAVDPAAAELRRLALAGDAGVRRLAAATYLPWYALPASQQRQRLATAWERLAAEGRAGVDYKVRSIYLAPPHPPVAPPPAEPSLTVGRGQPLALQVVGPGALELWAWPIGQVGTRTIELRLRRIAAGPTAAGLLAGREAVPGDRLEEEATDEVGVEARRLVVTSEGLREPLALAAGWWTIEVHTEGEPVAVQLRADAAERHAGPDLHAQHRDHAGAAFVPVDLRVLPLYRSGPGLKPLSFALGAEGDVDARLLEIEVRARGASAPVTVQYRFVDAEGRALVHGATLAETVVPAPFERLRRGGAVDVLEDRSQDVLEDRSKARAEDVLEDRSQARAADVPEDRSVGDEVAGLAGFPLAEEAVSEPVRLRLLAPLGAAALEVGSAEPALLAVRGRLPAALAAGVAGPRYTWPYDQVEDTALRWRYVARAAPRSFPRRADDHAARAAAGELMLLHAQVRAEARELVVGEAARWRAEHPRGGHGRLRLLERVPPERRAETLASWGPGTYTRLRRGSVEVIERGAEGPRPARAWVQATGSATSVVGQSMALRIGGQTLRWTIRAREGRTALPGSGPVELGWSEGPEDLLVLVDRPPGGRSGAPLYEHRQLHRLGGGGLSLTIEKPDAASRVLNVVLYWIGGAPEEASSLAVEIDGGSPRRREGAPVQGVTPGRRVLQVLPTRRVEVVLPDRRGLGIAGVARVAVILGDDLAPGRHTIRISPVGGPSLWARFFRAGVADVRGGALQWNVRRGAVSLEDSDDEEE